MMDFSKRSRRRQWRLPRGVKLMFLVLPWAFVAYGVSMLQDFVGFYNNSVAAQAEVVFVEPSRSGFDAEAFDAIKERGADWPLPSFLYKHENGRSYVGGPIVDASGWTYRPGQQVDIRYNRVAPDQAQPVTVFKFWWPPGLFIVGGFLVFLSLAVAFFLASDPDRVTGIGRRGKSRGLNLRRK